MKRVIGRIRGLFAEVVAIEQNNSITVAING